MAENKKSVLLYCDIIHTVEELTDEEAGKLFKHYLRYINDKNPVPPDKLTQVAFEPIKQSLKRDLRKWETKSEKNSRIAKEAWEKRKDANACERIKADAKNADSVSVSDKVTVTIKEFVVDVDELMKSETWCNTMCLKHSIKSLEALKLWIQMFNTHLVTIAEEHKTEQAYKRHFNSWIQKQPKQPASKLQYHI